MATANPESHVEKHVDKQPLLAEKTGPGEVLTEKGKAVKLVGTAQDVTEKQMLIRKRLYKSKKEKQ